MEPLLITIEEAAKLAGIGRDCALQLVASGEWPHVKVGKRKRMVRRADIIAMYGQVDASLDIQEEAVSA